MKQIFRRLVTGAYGVAAILAVGLIAQSPAMATTPDGETPANEGTCDVLKTNATPGLYGLCVAYCEAQDLDTFDKEPPGTKILENYNKKKTATDPAMPCIKIPCPCWTDAELASITSDNIASSCNRTSTKTQIVDNSTKTHFAEADTAVGLERCRYIDLNVLPTVVRTFKITAPEAAGCRAAVEAACAAVGK